MQKIPKIHFNTIFNEMGSSNSSMRSDTKASKLKFACANWPNSKHVFSPHKILNFLLLSINSSISSCRRNSRIRNNKVNFPCYIKGVI